MEKEMFVSRLIPLVMCLSLTGYGGGVFAQEPSGQGGRCGPLRPPGQYGPWDFRTDKERLPVVVNNHFSLRVENLIGGQTTTAVGGDIAFTLRAIPNHPNALVSIMLLGEREKTDQPVGSTYTVECWFDRAIRFRPDDNIVRMIYVSYLTKQNRKPEAIQQLQRIAADAKDNAITLNNVGLLYFDLGDYQEALLHAHKAIALGFARPELQQKLQQAGRWQDAHVNSPNSSKAESAKSPP
jgi:hypothetical protein